VQLTYPATSATTMGVVALLRIGAVLVCNSVCNSVKWAAQQVAPVPQQARNKLLRKRVRNSLCNKTNAAIFAKTILHRIR
jgi:hypothetical protein